VIRASLMLVLSMAPAFTAEVEAIPVQDDHGRHDIYLDTFTHVGAVTNNLKDGENYYDEDGQPSGHSERSATGAIAFYDRDGVYTGELLPNYSTGFDAFGPDGTYLGQSVLGFRGIPEYFDHVGHHINYSLFLVKNPDSQ
jgi:hypothetical protein